MPDIINKYIEQLNETTWFAVRELDDGKILKNKWDDDPEEWKTDGEHEWKSGQEKACQDLDGTLLNGGCNC